MGGWKRRVIGGGSIQTGFYFEPWGGMKSVTSSPGLGSIPTPPPRPWGGGWDLTRVGGGDTKRGEQEIQKKNAGGVGVGHRRGFGQWGEEVGTCLRLRFPTFLHSWVTPLN